MFAGFRQSKIVNDFHPCKLTFVCPITFEPLDNVFNVIRRNVCYLSIFVIFCLLFWNLLLSSIIKFAPTRNTLRLFVFDFVFCFQALRPPLTCIRSYTIMFWGLHSLRTSYVQSFLITPNGWVEQKYVWSCLFVFFPSSVMSSNLDRMRVLVGIQVQFNDCRCTVGIRRWALRAAVYQRRLWSCQQTVVLWPQDHSSGYYRYSVLVSLYFSKYFGTLRQILFFL